ncbi:MAG: bifunctional pyr operon transcriptional regulator/uracil phosphoribosyltransferase PyrR [Candidatus Omnitrophica bacterium]|nr:bifunctional pyr operon transcriptional regulator/uracil phosphoribosyltransferase PyrR [Candidatus Omnitrophota bacterium]MCM8808793.1 bifunctional pyr operon transcriptional regulator/uracil phosphoribosyltransferase PyrR [Candidatus Omnitrophota bacterium]MCM8810063.1 bifunctional pyr operon transcriptional regulator/uracil phosphoribosyltransferase PyrR [Candidatus Omnitrophota bacterium]
MERKIMDRREIEEILKEMADKIEREYDLEDLVLIGIKRRGAILADRVNKLLSKKLPVGYLDITFYRDDFSKIGAHPVVGTTEILFDIDNKKIILIDDVLYTGRTIRAALEALIDFGRPEFVKLFVLIDRGHRELPICADFVGKKIDIGKDEMVEVKLKEIDRIDEVIIVKKWNGKEKTLSDLKI